MDPSEVRRWFDEYLEAFAACGRGEREPPSLLAYYGVPLLVTSDASFAVLATEEQVMAVVQQQIDQMRSADYNHSVVVASEVIPLNKASALYRWTVSRQRRDGFEVSRLTFTDLLTNGASGRRISAIAIHSP